MAETNENIQMFLNSLGEIGHDIEQIVNKTGIDTYTFEDATVLRMNKPGFDRENNKPTLGFKAKMKNGEEREFVISGATGIKYIWSEFKKNGYKSILVPVICTRSKGLKQSDDGTWWMYTQ